MRKDVLLKSLLIGTALVSITFAARANEICTPADAPMLDAYSQHAYAHQAKIKARALPKENTSPAYGFIDLETGFLAKKGDDDKIQRQMDKVIEKWGKQDKVKWDQKQLQFIPIPSSAKEVEINVNGKIEKQSQLQSIAEALFEKEYGRDLDYSNHGEAERFDPIMKKAKKLQQESIDQYIVAQLPEAMKEIAPKLEGRDVKGFFSTTRVFDVKKDAESLKENLGENQYNKLILARKFLATDPSPLEIIAFDKEVAKATEVKFDESTKAYTYIVNGEKVVLNSENTKSHFNSKAVLDQYDAIMKEAAEKSAAEEKKAANSTEIGATENQAPDLGATETVAAEPTVKITEIDATEDSIRNFLKSLGDTKSEVSSLVKTEGGKIDGSSFDELNSTIQNQQSSKKDSLEAEREKRDEKAKKRFDSGEWSHGRYVAEVKSNLTSLQAQIDAIDSLNNKYENASLNVLDNSLANAIINGNSELLKDVRIEHEALAEALVDSQNLTDDQAKEELARLKAEEERRLREFEEHLESEKLKAQIAEERRQEAAEERRQAAEEADGIVKTKVDLTKQPNFKDRAARHVKNAQRIYQENKAKVDVYIESLKIETTAIKDDKLNYLQAKEKVKAFISKQENFDSGLQQQIEASLAERYDDTAKTSFKTLLETATQNITLDPFSGIDAE